MPLFVTSAINDADLVKALGKQAIKCSLPCGDVVFWSVDDDPDNPGQTKSTKTLIERKQISDICQCIVTGRYLHQLQNAYEAGFEHLILIAEGQAKADKNTGLLVVPMTQKIMLKQRRVWVPIQPETQYSRFDRYLTEVANLLGVIVKRSQDLTETVNIIKSCWLYFQKPASQHTSLEVMYKPPPDRIDLLRKPGLVRRMAAELDGIGWERSKEIEKQFGTVWDMVNANAEMWARVPGIGIKTAEKIVNVIRGE